MPLLVSVYRRGNEATLALVVEQARTAGWTIRLHALDTVSPQLASWTVSSGPGERFPLLDSLIGAHDGWVVLSDDDVYQPRLVRFLDTCRTYGFDLAQPAHAWRSHGCYSLLFVRPWLAVRSTSFVEIGPLVAMGPAAHEEVRPFCSEGMGWGVDLQWHQRFLDGELRLGVVDATPMWHLGMVGAAYEWQSEDDRVQRMLRAQGYNHVSDAQQTVTRLAYRRPSIPRRTGMPRSLRKKLLSPHRAAEMHWAKSIRARMPRLRHRTP